MKQHLVSAVVLAAMTVGQAVPVIALAGNEPSVSPLRGDLKERREDMKERRTDLREEVKERLSNIRKERIRAWLKRMQRRLGSLVERQYKLADKIGKKLDRADEAGKDVTALRAQLAEAKTKIDAAKKALDGMTAQLESILTDNSPREAFAKIHELQKGVFGKIREAHQALVKVLTAMRGLSVTPSPSVSPTP